MYVSGTHLSPEIGLTVRSIETDEFEIGDRIELVLPRLTPKAIAKSMGLGLIRFGQSFSKYGPKILDVLGDRYKR